MSVTLAAICGILLLAAFLRFHELGAQSFWNDEGNSARIVERTPALIVEAAAGDIHPPLYYLALAGWRLPAGFSEFALRAFSAFCGLLTVALTLALGRRLLGTAVGLLGALIVAAHSFQVYYSQEARMYALMAALAAGSMYAWSRWLEARATKWAAMLVLLNAAGLYTQYAYPVVMIAQGALLLAWWRREERRPAELALYAGVILAPIALYLPWLPVAARQVTTWPTVDAGETLSQALTRMTTLLVYGLDISPIGLGRALWAAAIPLIVAAVPVLVRKKLRETRGRSPKSPSPGLTLLWLWALLPVVGMFALKLYRPAFLKALLVGHAPVAMLIAWGLVALLRVSRPTAVLGLLCLAGVSVGLLVGLDHLYNDPVYARADYRAIAHRVEEEARPGDAVLLNAANQWEVFTYYHREGAPVYPLPRERPADADATRVELDDILSAYDRLFVLYWGDAESDPARVVESYLSERAFIVSATWYKDVRLVVYAVPPVGDAEPAVTLDARFGEHIRLIGYALHAPEPAHPGGALTLSLFWRADAPIEARYKVFVHLLDAGGRIVAQHDGEPAGDLRPTTAWEVGETVTDNHGLLIPADAALGEYRLRVGLYLIDKPAERLPVFIEGEPAGDSLPLATVEVE